MLTRLGVAKGDRVVIYMPMVPEAVVAMLGCARIGAVHSVVFGGFAPPELASRIDDATPKVVVTASCGIEGNRVIEYKPLLDQALRGAVHEPSATVVLQRPQVAAALRALRKEDPEGRYLRQHDISALRYLFLAGERLDPETWRWASQQTGVPVIDHWWQTESGWAIAANPAGLELLPIKPGSPSLAMPGWDLRVLDAHGRPLPAGTEGALAARLPLPPGALTTLWGDDERFVSSYLSAFEGYYLSGDGGSIDSDGYVFVMGRADDVINVAGHRLSTGAMEEVIATHPDVAECAVIGVHDALKGQAPRGLVVLKAGIDPQAPGYRDSLRRDIFERIRTRISPIASLRDVDIVAGLPKTRSGKILRKTMREIADGIDTPVPATIDDPAVLDQLRPVLLRPEACRTTM